MRTSLTLNVLTIVVTTVLDTLDLAVTSNNFRFCGIRPYLVVSLAASASSSFLRKWNTPVFGPFHYFFSITYPQQRRASSVGDSLFSACLIIARRSGAGTALGLGAPVRHVGSRLPGTSLDACISAVLHKWYVTLFLRRPQLVEHNYETSEFAVFSYSCG
ncbi:hypothetical protein EDB83DRAFT_1598334 [Lactarius deliciosus]|nr:hypothetical protein EDB83DRAFT_1598334 [Lactarius deliciosus]